MKSWELKIPPLQKLLVLYIEHKSGTVTTISELAKVLHVNEFILRQQIQTLISKQILTLNCNKLFFNNNFLIIEDTNSIVVRKPKTPVEHSKQFLESFNGFVGRDKLVYEFYKLFCTIFQDEFGKRFSCFPEVPKQAKKSKYWKLFDNFYEVIEQHNLIPEVAIRAQIRRAKQISKYSNIAPSIYVILNTNKALQTYIDYVETQMERKLLLEPYTEELKKAYEYSDKLFNELKRNFPELSDEEILQINHELLSPVWLVRNKIYMKLLNSDKIAPTDNVLQLLKNMKNKDFKHLIMNL